MKAPNDLKLSEPPARRDRCMAGGKAEAGSSGRDAQAGSLQRMVRSLPELVIFRDKV